MTVAARPRPQPKANPERAVSSARGTLAGALAVEREIGPSGEPSPQPLDILIADDPAREGWSQARAYREALLVAVAKLADLQQTVDHQRETIARMREEMRAIAARGCAA